MCSGAQEGQCKACCWLQQAPRACSSHIAPGVMRKCLHATAMLTGMDNPCYFQKRKKKAIILSLLFLISLVQAAIS